MPTGQLVRQYRIARKKNTVNVATHAGITVRYLEMIEAGTKTPSLPVLRKLAKVLRVRTSALIGEAPSEDHEGPVNPGLAATERALYTYRSVSLTDRDTPPELPDLTQRTTAAWDTLTHLLIGAAMWSVGQGALSDDMPQAARRCGTSASSRSAGTSS